MRILTLTQPWATLVALGAKHIETRSWSTPYRGPIAIHAAKGLGPVGGANGLFKLCGKEPFFDVLMEGFARWKAYPEGYYFNPASDLPRGAIVAVAELVGCPRVDRIQALQPWRHTDLQGRVWEFPITPQERAFGDYSAGRYAWLLSDVRPLRTPLAYAGAQGLRALPADVVAHAVAHAEASL